MNIRETRTPENLLAGGVVPYLRESMELEPGNYKRGELLQLKYENLKLEKCVSINKFFGVLSEDINIKEEEEGKAMVYVGGMFYKAGVITEDSITINTALIIEARQLNIYFR